MDAEKFGAFIAGGAVLVPLVISYVVLRRRNEKDA